MKTLKSNHLNKTMHLVLNNCKDCIQPWSGSSLQSFCNDLNNKNSLYVLSNEGYINIITDDFGTIHAVLLLESGLYYFGKKSDERKLFIKNFLSQFLTGFLSGVGVTIAITFLSKCIEK